MIRINDDNIVELIEANRLLYNNQFDKIVKDPMVLINPQVTTIYNYDSAVNVGCNFRYVNNHFGVMAGLGLVDRFKFTIVVRL